MEPWDPLLKFDPKPSPLFFPLEWDGDTALSFGGWGPGSSSEEEGDDKRLVGKPFDDKLSAFTSAFVFTLFTAFSGCFSTDFSISGGGSTISSAGNGLSSFFECFSTVSSAGDEFSSAGDAFSTVFSVGDAFGDVCGCGGGDGEAHGENCGACGDSNPSSSFRFKSSTTSTSIGRGALSL